MSKDLECIKGWPLTYSPPFVSKKWQAKAREPILDLLMSKGTIIQHKKKRTDHERREWPCCHSQAMTWDHTIQPWTFQCLPSPCHISWCPHSPAQQRTGFCTRCCHAPGSFDSAQSSFPAAKSTLDAHTNTAPACRSLSHSSALQRKKEKEQEKRKRSGKKKKRNERKKKKKKNVWPSNAANPTSSLLQSRKSKVQFTLVHCFTI